MTISPLPLHQYKGAKFQYFRFLKLRKKWDALHHHRKTGGNRRKPTSIGEVSVYVPGLRIPRPVDFLQSLGDQLPMALVERLTVLRTRIVVMANQEGPTITRTRRKTQHGGSTLSGLHQALVDYLPVILGLSKDGSHLQFKVRFDWVNQEDEEEVLVMVTTIRKYQKVRRSRESFSYNFSRLRRFPIHSVMFISGRFESKNLVTKWDENRRASIDIFLRAARYLDCAVKNVLPQFSAEQMRNLPVDLAEGVLRALCLQALGQGVGIQLGMAIDSSKAILAVKRRLSCEMVKYWQQAQDNLMNLPLANGWGEKHRHYVKWKYVEAKSAAYYYHGMILDEGNTEKSHGIAVAALKGADECFKESKKASEAFNAMSPTSRTPPLFGTMKYLTEKMPKDTWSKVRINRDLYSYEKIMETAPTLPDFALALKPDEYQLPLVEA